jgi:hypothetical protein
VEVDPAGRGNNREEEAQMETQRSNVLDMLLIAATILAVPMGAYHLSIGLYTQAAMAFMAGGAGVMLLSGWDPAAAWVERDTEPVEEIPLYSLSTPVLIRVAEAQGDCIRKYAVDDTWTSESSGKLSHPLCRAAAYSLASAMSDLLAGEAEAGQRISCQCPLMDRQITFALQAA